MFSPQVLDSLYGALNVYNFSVNYDTFRTNKERMKTACIYSDLEYKS